MSIILAKLKAAATTPTKRGTSKPGTGQSAPALPPETATGWTPARSRGRPRLNFAARYAEVAPPITEFVTECLVPVAGAAIYLGAFHKSRARLSDGRRVPIILEYPTVTLTQAWIEFLRSRDLPVSAPKTLVGHIVRECLRRGWDVRVTRAYHSRRKILRGINVKGQPVWNGDDSAFGYSRKGRSVPDNRAHPTQAKANATPNPSSDSYKSKPGAEHGP